MNRLSLLPLLALAVAPCLAQDPAATAPAEPPVVTARLASVDAVESAIQGVLAAVGRPGMPPEASPRHWLAELCDVEPARPVVIRLWTGADGEPEGVVAVPGAECLYNILIMEELQSIAAFGAAASTKRVYEDGRIERSISPKDVKTYLERREQV